MILSFEVQAEMMQETEQSKRELAELKAKQQEGFKEMQERMQKQIENLESKLMSKITKSEADRLDLFQPKIEDIDKKTPVEVMVELFDKGYMTIPVDKLRELYTSSITSTIEKQEQEKEKEESNKIITFPSNTEIEAELRPQQQKKQYNPVRQQQVFPSTSLLFVNQS